MDRKDNLTSWVVVVVVTLTLFLEMGTIKSFSVLLPEIKEDLDTYTWVVGGSISIIIGWGCVFGLSAGALVETFGPRFCVMVCGLVSSAGLIVCTYATSVPILVIGLFLTGFTNLQENIVIGVVPEYFDRYFNTAVAIYSCGGGLGVIIMPLLTQMFLDIYGWRGTLFLLSGLNLHSVVCGAILKQMSVQKKQKNTDVKENKYLQTSGNTLLAEESSSKLPIIRVIRHMICSSLLTKATFITQAFLPGFMFGYAYIGWMIYIVSFALSNGLSMKESSIVASFGGIGFTTVRIVLPLLHKLMTYKQLLYVSSVIASISLILLAVSNSFIEMSLFSVLFGIGIGTLGAELYISAKYTSDEDEYYNAVAWVNLSHGAGSILSGFLTGWLFNKTGSFKLSFVMLGAMSFLTVVSLGFGKIVDMITSRKADRDRVV